MRNPTMIMQWLLLALVVFVAASVATADASLASHQPAKKSASPKTASVVVRTSTATTMDSRPSVIPGIDTLPLAQAQKAAAAAKIGEKALESGDLAEADTEFRYSVGLDDSNPDALAGLAETFEQEGKNPQAIAVYRYLLYPKKGWGTSMERDPILRMHFALLLAGDGQWPEAVYVYESTIGGVSIGPAYPKLDVHFSSDTPQPALFQAMAHLAMGITYNGQLEHDKALTEYEAALRAQPNLALAYYCRGYGFQMLGKRTLAKADFAKAAELGEGDVKKAAQSPDGLLPH